MAADDFIMTIDSDDDDRPPPKGLRYAASQNVDPEDAQLNAEFTFDLNGDPYTDIIGEFHSRDIVKTGSGPVNTLCQHTMLQFTIFYCLETNLC